MDGILAVWKPEGWTSHDVVAKVRRILKMKRIGHAGTLDPMVTGVLPLCLGRATRVVEYVQERPKAYEAVLQLGIATDTEDLTGTIVDRQPVINVAMDEIRSALGRFAGEIWQVPPMFSAVKVDGKRLYELAREGKTVERKPRKVMIHHIELIDAQLEQDQPTITFSVLCSKGTYIRTLCVDIGKALGVPAAMAKLTRTMSGGITKESCLTLEQIERLQQSGELEARLIPADQAIAHMDKAVVPAAVGKQALLGQRIGIKHAGESAEHAEPGRLVRLYSEEQAFLGIFEVDAAANAFKPVKVFSNVES
ncbi:tRNA pseudouridine(55) synthase TruB [Paenibacillus arenilitoris]|uniref:tRNA pseudouridine synthase B n=1 Tax=Paenibacillus arenilitoris TaxID=2772299 RepID=A0A927H6L5_9BACL|nr:tRNA pseudouridine(55) synthase TruB [Paenibacillus arenilitoris]MBD2870691.1 tRNA pseudouridine(55) synthase TruB [Paenibacillus arenilitoris]